MSQGVLVPVKKADIPEAFLPYIKQDTLAGRITSKWTEVVGWGSCKLVVRKQGAITRFAHSHYGYYECCKIAEIQTLGYATEGTSYTELPMWALTLWIVAKGKAKEAIASGYNVTQTRVRLMRWERKAMNQFVIYFKELETGSEWRVEIFRGDTKPHMRFRSRHLDEYLTEAA